MVNSQENRRERILRNISVLKAIVKHRAQVLIYMHALIQEIVTKCLCVTGSKPNPSITRVMVPVLRGPLIVQWGKLIFMNYW